jgi:hypothetical protein
MANVVVLSPVRTILAPGSFCQGGDAHPLSIPMSAIMRHDARRGWTIMKIACQAGFA